MAYNPGQDLAVVEAKMATKAALKRLGFSLGFGGVTLGFLLAVAPPQMVQNLTCYLIRAGHFELGKVGLTKLSSRDLFELARASTLVSRDGGLWAIFLGLSGSVSALAFGILSYLFWRRGQRSKLDHVLRGAKLVTAFEHNRAMRRSYSQGSLLKQKLCLGTKKLIVPEALQYLHFAFAGASGSGKSTAIEELMEQAIARGDKGLIVDLGGAFYSKFGRPHDHVLSLRDPRSEAWDFWSEEGIPEEAFASAMIESEGTTNPYFWKGARAVLASLLRTNSSVRELLIDFARPLPEIREKLAQNGELSLRIIGEDDGDQADGIIGTTVLDFAFLRELNQHAKTDQKPFSIARWINDHSDSSWTYILLTEADLEVAKPLIRTWFDVACLATLLRRPGDPELRHTWLILDEAKTIGRLPSLPHILDKGRKFKTSVVLGFQAVSQLETVYGKSEARSILQGLQNQVLFRMSEASSAEYASEFLGEQEVEQASVGQSFDDKSERGSVNHSLVKKQLVMAEEVRNLEALNAFMRLARHAPVHIKFVVKKRERVQEFAQSVKAVPRALKEEKIETDNHNREPIMPFAPQGLST